MSMRNFLTHSDTSYSDVPVQAYPNGDIKNFMHHFWHMLDFPRHGELAEAEPKLEIAENKKQVTVSAELPGVAENDIDVQVSADGYLTISAEKHQETTSDENNNYFSEISYGMFRRTIPLPWDLDYAKTSANFDNGLLKIAIPKSTAAQEKVKKISIKKAKKN